MLTEQTRTAMRQELRALSQDGATLSELLGHLGEQNERLGKGGLSDDQKDELELYCTLCKGQSGGAVWGHATVPGGFEDDIGA